MARNLDNKGRRLARIWPPTKTNDPMDKTKIGGTVNQLARLIIALHEEGYHNDFEFHGDDRIWDAQENRSFVFDEVYVNQVCLIGGRLGKAARFILAVETAEGRKGLLVGNPVSGFLLNYKINCLWNYMSL